MKLTFFQPEIPQNVGALLRLSAAFKVPIDFIGPFPFVWSDRHLKRASLDYGPKANYQKHVSWQSYQKEVLDGRRHVFLVPGKGEAFSHFSFKKNDCLVLGSESCGFPQDIEQQADELVHIPMEKDVRSLNVAMAGAIVLSYALVQQEFFGKTKNLF